MKGKDHHEKTKCTACDGAGLLEWDCPDCWGSGYAPDVKTMMRCEDGSNRCPTCCGKGKIQAPCLICGGSG